MTAYSLCIPRIFNNIPDKKITTTFENLNIGKIKSIDIIDKIGRDGSTFKMAFVHFESWNYYNSSAVNLRKQIEDPNLVAKIVYDDPWHWILLPNTSNVTSESVYTTGSPCSINKQLNRGFHAINPSLEERLTNLENELHCVYKELYQREYIPSRYHHESYWDGDIETGTDTGSDIELLHSRSFTPMSISELDTQDYNDDTKLHEAPNLANCIPFKTTQYDSESYQYTLEEDDMSVLSDISSQQGQDNLYNIQYDIEQGGKDGSYVAMVNQNNKLWVTANYCGND